MEQTLGCEIVRDLLPSYADGLTCEVTNQAVETHLSSCADCTAALARMKAPEEEKTAPAAEVDYLKKVRRRSTGRSLVVGIVLMLLGMSLLGYRYLYVGSLAEATDVNFSVSVAGNTVSVGGNACSSTSGVSRVVFEESAGIVFVKVYTAPRSPLARNSFHAAYTAQSDTVGMVRCGDLILWEGGTAISPTAARLFAAMNPYVGDMPSNSRIAEILGVGEQFGAYENELHTSSQPYGWTLALAAPISQDEEAAALDVMTADAYAMLACVGNLGYVTWQYETENGARVYTVSAEEATAFAGRDIKAFADSVSEFQSLVQSLSFKWSGVQESVQEDGAFRLSVSNDSGEPLRAISVDYYLDGVFVGSRSVQTADASSLADGQTITFGFIPRDFPDGTSSVQLADFSFDLSVTDQDGVERVVRTGVPVSAKYARTFYFTLRGGADGFALQEG